MDISSKTRSKNFSIQENNTLVDLILENKANLFGALSSSLTFDEKSAIWGHQKARMMCSKNGATFW